MTVAVNVSAGEAGTIQILMDEEDVQRLDGRKLSLGSHGYPQLWDNGKLILLHRWIMNAQPGDGKIVDHKFGNTSDFTKVNLRLVTASESSANVRAHASSGYRGVYPNRGKWTARCKLNGKMHNLGTFDTKEEAAEVSHEWRVKNLPGYTGRDRIC